LLILYYIIYYYYITGTSYLLLFLNREMMVSITPLSLQIKSLTNKLRPGIWQSYTNSH